jgi:hypothetical protein
MLRCIIRTIVYNEMVTVNLYEILGISRDATPEEIEAAYWHMTELNKEELAADPKGRLWCFLQIAHDNLLDPEKRAAHDAEIYGTEESVVKHVPRDAEPQVEAAVQNAIPAPVAPQNAPVVPVAPSQVPIAPSALPFQTPASAASTSQSTEEDYLKHISKPVIDWSALPWVHASYSHFSEKVSSKQPGLTKGMWSFWGFTLALFLSAIYASTFKFEPFKGFPVPVFFAVLVAILWVKYFKFNWKNKKFYLGSMAIFSVATLTSILFGKNSGSNAPVLAVIFAIICALAGYWGLVAAKHGGHWMSVQTFRQNIRHIFAIRRLKLSAKEIKNTRTWGIAGNLSDATEVFGAQAVALGSAGEKFTAELMDQLLRIPGTRVFHGLQYPGSENADVDHAIVNGNKIVFVDSKLWKAGDYSWQWDGVIQRKNGTETTPINTTFHHAVQSFYRKMAGVEIRSNILIHSASGKPVNIDNSNTEKTYGKSPETRMVTAQQFLAETGAWFSEGKPGYVDKSIVKYLYAQLKR